MKIVVQKFGGTSVSTDENRKQVIEKVRNAIKEGYSPVVVVSAMGRKGEPYATDTLLSLIDDKFKNTNKLAQDLLWFNFNAGRICKIIICYYTCLPSIKWHSVNSSII